MRKSLIRQAYIAVIAFCITIPVVAEDARPQQYLFTNVMVFDGSGDESFKADVLVSDNKIEQVSPEPLSLGQSDGVEVIDGGGRTLMPGMIDGHNHIMLPASPLNLAYNYHWTYGGPGCAGSRAHADAWLYNAA